MERKMNVMVVNPRAESPDLVCPGSVPPMGTDNMDVAHSEIA